MKLKLSVFLLCVALLSLKTDVKTPKNTSKGYIHRAALGCWVNDMRNSALPTEQWPSIIFDDETEEGLLSCMDLMKKAGFESLNVFGLLSTYSWKINISETISEERRADVSRLLKAAHDRGLKLHNGLGVYSWGFDEIIANNPCVQGTNPHALCYSSPESFEWMKKVLDYVLTFNFDGYHLEASDQGRCHCEKCSAISDVVYYSKINAMCADYIREKKNDAVLLVNMCGYLPWGDSINCEADFQALVDLSSRIDFLIDPGHRGLYVRGEYRTRACKELKCDFGTSSCTWVYMPQRWDKLRWFLPTVLRSCGFLQEDYHRGARAAELFMGATINPGVEMTILCSGKLMQNPKRNIKSIIRESVNELYEPKNRKTGEKLVDIFIRAELAYFENVNQLYMDKNFLGEIFLEWVLGTVPGTPYYLHERNDLGENVMSLQGMVAYRDALKEILPQLDALENEVGRPEKIQRIKTCIENVITDVASVER